MDYLFYDYETSGLCEKFDQVFQFAAIKTNDRFEPIDEPVELFCKLRSDVLPSPIAVAINQIDIHELNSKGLNEFEFAKRVNQVMIGTGNQCIAGYNSKNFDNNFSRFLFYRNFLHPYQWSFANSNFCFDIFDVVLLGYSFDRLDTIIVKDGGTDSLKLEDLSKWNELLHIESHNALSDVHATVQLAKLLNERCPGLWEYAFSQRHKEASQKLFDQGSLFYSSSFYNGRESSYLSLHAPIGRHPVFAQSRIAWKLQHDPTQILDLTPDEIRLQMYSKKESRVLEVGFDEFKLNKCPMIVQFAEKEKGRIANIELCLENLEKVRLHQDKLKELADEVFKSTIPELDPDADLYCGDFRGECEIDASCIRLVQKDPLSVEPKTFASRRLGRMLRRLRARNFYDHLPDGEKKAYQDFCMAKFAFSDDGRWRTRAQFENEFAVAVADLGLSEKQRKCLSVLKDHVETIY